MNYLAFLFINNRFLITNEYKIIPKLAVNVIIYNGRESIFTNNISDWNVDKLKIACVNWLYSNVQNTAGSRFSEFLTPSMTLSIPYSPEVPGHPQTNQVTSWTR